MAEMQEKEVKVEARAELKYARISSRKVKIVADLIRGKDGRRKESSSYS